MIRDYLQLARLPNVFTAMADVAMGFLFVQPVVAQADFRVMLLLIAASSFLYAAGVVLNDVFDLDADRIERSERPIPSGRVSLLAARRLGWALMLFGVWSGGGASIILSHARPAVVAVLLAIAVLLYDAWLKRTALGPLGMGLCRLLNVILGMSAIDSPLQAENWLVAGGIGVYIAGVTWFARTEAKRSSRLHLAMATCVMALGIAMLAWFPSWSRRVVTNVWCFPTRWWLLMGSLGILILLRSFRAIIEPTPRRVRIAVTQCILSLVMLDAVACYAVCGVFWASMILLLLAPAMFFGRWIAAT